MKRPSSSCPTTKLLRLTLLPLLLRREIRIEPVAQHAPDPCRILVEEKVVETAEQVQLRRLTRASEHLDGLLGRRYRIVGGVDEQKRARRDLAYHLLGAEIEH